MDVEEEKRVPIGEGLLTAPLNPLENVRLLGSRCKSCGEVALATVSSCSNCGSEDLDVIPLSGTGTLWTYTVIRNRPPGDYRGADPFVPFAEGLVELPDGIRVLSPLGGDIDKLAIGMEMKFEASKFYRNADGADVIAFKFVPSHKA